MWLVIALRFIPTCVGQMTRYGMHAPGDLRFIPTCVGQIDGVNTDSATPSTVHPHVRGADFLPPVNHRTLFRFIPTCVGQIVSHS